MAKCQCGHIRGSHGGDGCEVCALDGLNILHNHAFIPALEKPLEPEFSETERWKTGRCRDCEEPIPQGPDRCNACAWKARNAEPQEPVCGHLSKHCTGARFNAAGGERFYSCPDCGAKYTETVPVCAHCQGPHPYEECKGLEEPEEGVCVCGHPEGDHRAGLSHPHSGCNWCKVEQCGGYRTEPEDRCTCGDTACESELCDCDSAPWTVDHAREEPPPPPPRRPPYAVAYAVEGGAQYEVAVSGDATVVAEDGVLMVLHPKKPVLAIVRIQPMHMEDESNG